MRFKKTEVCQTCSKMKNVCQTCLLDLEFGNAVCYILSQFDNDHISTTKMFMYIAQVCLSRFETQGCPLKMKYRDQM